jgi:hypothetical protein
LESILLLTSSFILKNDCAVEAVLRDGLGKKRKGFLSAAAVILRSRLAQYPKAYLKVVEEWMDGMNCFRPTPLNE